MSDIVRYVMIPEPEEQKTLASTCHSKYKFDCPICGDKAVLIVDTLNNKMTIEHKCDCSFTTRRGSLGGFVIMAIKTKENVTA